MQQTLFVSDSTHLWRANAGWTSFRLHDPGHLAGSFVTTGDNVIGAYGAYPTQIFVSVDGGHSWSSVTPRPQL